MKEMHLLPIGAHLVEDVGRRGDERAELLLRFAEVDSGTFQNLQGLAELEAAFDQFSLRCAQEQRREFSVTAQESLHVGLVLQMRVRLGPIVCSANERQIRDQQFENHITDRRTHRRPGSARGRWPQKDDRQGIEEIAFELAAGLGQWAARRHPFEPCKGCRECRVFRNGPVQQLDNVIDSVQRRAGISGWATVPGQEANVPDDAVADPTESGEVNEQALLEQRGQRAVEIGGPGKFPEFLDQAGCRVSGAEEIGKNAETVGDLAPKRRVYPLIRHMVRHTRLPACECRRAQPNGWTAMAEAAVGATPS